MNRTKTKDKGTVKKRKFFYDEATKAKCIVRVRIECYDDMNPSKEKWE